MAIDAVFKLLHDGTPGRMVVAAGTPPNMRNHWAPSISAAARFIDRNIDSNVYIRHAAFGEQKNRYGNISTTVENVTGARSFFADFDVKPVELQKPKQPAYPTTAEARIAVERLIDFGSRSNVPPPSLVIMSGHGFHIVWVLEDWLNAERWDKLNRALQNYLTGSGFLHDKMHLIKGVRAPGTFNVKNGLQKPVYVVEELSTWERIPNDRFIGAMRDHIAQDVSALPGEMPPQAEQPIATAGELNGNMPPREFNPYDFRESCAVIGDALADGGAKLTWNSWSLLLQLGARATDPDTGNRFAHDVSKGYVGTGTAPGYDPARVDRELENLRRTSTKFPRCATFSDHCTQCETCPVGPKSDNPANSPATSKKALNLQRQQVADDWGKTLPEAGYINRFDGVVQLVRDGDEVEERMILWQKNITDVQVHAIGNSPGRRLHAAWRAVGMGGDCGLISLTTDDLTTPQTMATCMARQGLPLENPKGVHRMFISWLDVLRNKAPEKSAAHMGWADDNSHFTLGGTLYEAAGVRELPLDDTSRPFVATGDEAEWFRVVNLLLGPDQRPEAHALVASGLAAPLMALTGHRGASLNFYSPSSGEGKSGFGRIAASIWGFPKAMLVGVNDTDNAQMRRMSVLRTLPLFIDEVRGDDIGKFINRSLFRVAHGQEKRRLNSSSTEQDMGEWRTLAVYMTNVEFKHTLDANAHEAELARVLEFRMPPLVQTMSVAQAQMEVDTVYHTYGHLGPKVAAKLVTDRKAIQQRLVAVQDVIMIQFGLTPASRLHAAVGAALIVGAEIANQVGLMALKPQLVVKAVSAAIRGQVAAAQTRRSATRSVSILRDFLKAFEANRSVMRQDSNGKPVFALDARNVRLPFVFEVDLSAKTLAVDVECLREFWRKRGYRGLQPDKSLLADYPTAHVTNVAMGLGFMPASLRPAVVLQIDTIPELASLLEV